MKGLFRFGDPIVEFSVEGRNIEFLLDTGFNGQLMLSKTRIEELKLEQIGFSDYTTASGENQFTTVYLATLDFFGNKKECVVLSTEGDFCLIGLELLDECRILIQRSKNVLEITK